MTDHAPSVVAPATAGWPKATLREALNATLAALAMTYSAVPEDGRPHWCRFGDNHDATCRGMLQVQDDARAALRAESVAASPAAQCEERLTKLRAFLEDEGNYAGGVWGDYGQTVVDTSMVWDIIDGRPHEWEMSSEYAATLNQAKEALEACEERAALHAPPALDAAWAEAEAALPDGWWIHALDAWSFDDMAYRAEAASPGRQIDMSHSASTKRHGTKRFVSGPSENAYGPTPAAALQALAVKLRAATPASGEPAAPQEEQP